MHEAEVRYALALGLSVLRVGRHSWVLRTRWTAHLPHWYAGIDGGFYVALEAAMTAMRKDLSDEDS